MFHEELATVTGSSRTFKKVAGKKLKNGTFYKVLVVALDNSDHVISTSKIVHVATKGKNNHIKVTTKAKNNKVSLKKGKSFKLGANAVGNNVAKYVGVRFESSNPKIVTVSKTGKIKGLKKGTCKIYVFAQNGLCTTIKVTVN